MQNNESAITQVNRKIRVLQGLRGVAFLLVFLSHSYGRLKWFGALGVVIFLQLSGFLQVYGYKVENKELKPLKDRLNSCLKKVYPLHVVTLLLSLPLTIEYFITVEGFSAFVANLLLIQSYIPVNSFYFSFNAVSWYLCIVILCTLLGSVFVKILDRTKKHIVYGIVIILLQFIICYLGGYTNNPHWIIYIFPFVRVLDYLLGMLGAFYYITLRTNLYAGNDKSYIDFCKIFVIFVFLVILVLFSIDSSNEILSVVTWSVPVMFLIPCIMKNSKWKLLQFLLENKVIVFLGEISFELFLFHQLVIRYVRAVWNKFDIPFGEIKYVICLIIAIVTSLIWLKLKEYILKRQS